MKNALLFCLAAGAVPLVPLLVEGIDWVYLRVRPLSKPRFFPVINSARVVILTYEDWARHARAEHPLRFFIHETVLNAPQRIYGRVRYSRR